MMRFSYAFLTAACLVVASGCNSGGSDAPASGSKTTSKPLEKLGIVDAKVGTGEPVKVGDEVWVLYTGKLADGTMFDSTSKRNNDPFHLKVGAGSVIKGWDMGLVGMKLGGERNLAIPSNLGYGEKPPQGPIPPNADLFFNIKLQSILRAEDADSITIKDVTIGTGKEAKDGNTVSITYRATANGTEFDSSKGPESFKIGADKTMIPGFDKALIGMKVGGVRNVVIPPDLTRMLRNEKLGMNLATYEVHLTNVQ